MPSTFNVFKTWSAGDILTASDLNSSFTQFTNNLDPSGLGPTGTTLAAWRNTSNPYPNNVEALPASFLIEMQQIKYVLLGLNGGQYWYQSAGYMSAGLVAATSLYDGISGYRVPILPKNVNASAGAFAIMIRDGQGRLPIDMTGEASAKSVTSPVLLDLGSVTSGDRILITVSGQGNPTQSGAGYFLIKASKSSGTSTGVFANDLTESGNVWTGNTASTPLLVGGPCTTAIWEVTGSGTLVMQGVVIKDATASLTSVQIYAFFLKKQ